MRKSIQVILASIALAALTACSSTEKTGQSSGITAAVERAASEDGASEDAVAEATARNEGRDEAKEPGKQTDAGQDGGSAPDGKVLMITSMEGEVPPNNIAAPDLQRVKLSIRDGALYLDEEVAAVQGGVGKNKDRDATPDYLVKVKPGPISAYSHNMGKHDILGSGAFSMDYINDNHTVIAKLSLGNHVLTSEDYLAGSYEGVRVTASDGTLMTLEGYHANQPEDGIKMATMFEPGLGSIYIWLGYAHGAKQLATGDEVMELIKPHLEDFKSRFEVVSEWDSEDASPASYVQLDCDSLSYNVDNENKLQLDFNITMNASVEHSQEFISMEFKKPGKDLKLKMEPGKDGFSDSTNINGEYVKNKDLYKQYGKGLLVPLEREGNGAYRYDEENMVLLTDKAAVKAWSNNGSEDGLTKEEIRGKLDFIFGNGALVLK